MGSKTKVDRYRRHGFLMAIGAVTMGSVMIVGCSKGIEGAARPNEVQAAAYQSEVTSSVAAASSSKAAAEAAENVFATCEEMLLKSKDDVSAFNAYVDANNNGADVAGKAFAAAASSDGLASWLDDVSVGLPAHLSGLFEDLAMNLRSIVRVIKRDHSADEINSIIDTTNSIRETIRSECGAL